MTAGRGFRGGCKKVSASQRRSNRFSLLPQRLWRHCGDELGMAQHEFKLVYDGLGATNHVMPTSIEKQITSGAQEFLGAHAYFFTEGRVPDNVGDHSRYFHIHDLRQRDGSWEAIYAVEISTFASGVLAEYIRELTKDLALDAATLTRLGFRLLVLQSYKCWLNRRPIQNRVFDRIEPVFTETTGNKSPIFDIDLDGDSQRRRLFERTNSSMVKITSPINRAATHVDMWIDEVKLDRRERRVPSEAEITAAVAPLRANRGSQLYS